MKCGLCGGPWKRENDKLSVEKIGEKFRARRNKILKGGEVKFAPELQIGTEGNHGQGKKRRKGGGGGPAPDRERIFLHTEMGYTNDPRGERGGSGDRGKKPKPKMRGYQTGRKRVSRNVRRRVVKNENGKNFRQPAAAWFRKKKTADQRGALFKKLQRPTQHHNQKKRENEPWKKAFLHTSHITAKKGRVNRREI